jgi:hypothetical protein
MSAPTKSHRKVAAAPAPVAAPVAAEIVKNKKPKKAPVVVAPQPPPVVESEPDSENEFVDGEEVVAAYHECIPPPNANIPVKKRRTKPNNTFKAVGIKRPSLYGAFMKWYFNSLPKGSRKNISDAYDAYKLIRDDPKKMAPHIAEYNRLLRIYSNEYESQKQSAIDRGDYVVKIVRPVSAYMLFSTSPEIREQAKIRNMSAAEIAKYCGTVWQQMDDAEKEPYNRQALADKAAYELTEDAMSKKKKKAPVAAAAPAAAPAPIAAAPAPSFAPSYDDEHTDSSENLDDEDDSE